MAARWVLVSLLLQMNLSWSENAIVCDGGLAHKVVEGFPRSFVKIKITSTKLPMRLSGTSSTAEHFVTEVRTASERFNLHEMRALDIAARANLIIRIGDEDIELPLEMKRRLLDILRNGSMPSQSFDCCSFVRYMNGLDYGFRIRDDDWRFVAFNDLRSGDTVVIGKRIGNNFFGIHYATFLGQNRYLSKFGATGPLLVTTLSDMLTVYESNQVLKAVPR